MPLICAQRFSPDRFDRALARLGAVAARTIVLCASSPPDSWRYPDVHATDAAEIAQHIAELNVHLVAELNVHLGQRLLHALHRAARFRYQITPVAP